MVLAKLLLALLPGLAWQEVQPTREPWFFIAVMFCGRFFALSWNGHSPFVIWILKKVIFFFNCLSDAFNSKSDRQFCHILKTIILQPLKAQKNTYFGLENKSKYFYIFQCTY